MASNPIRYRSFTTASDTFDVTRDGAKLFIQKRAKNASRAIECKTISEAKRLINNPASICSF